MQNVTSPLVGYFAKKYLYVYELTRSQYGINGSDKAHEPTSPLVTVKRNPRSPLIDPTNLMCGGLFYLRL